MYSYTGGHRDGLAANRTDHLLQAALDELQHMPETPCLILGDLNAEPSDLPTLRKLQSLGWVDLASSAAIWGREPNQPTCKSPNPRIREARPRCVITLSLLPWLWVL